MRAEKSRAAIYQNRCDLGRPWGGMRRVRRGLADCTCGVLSCRDRKNGFSKEAHDFDRESPVVGRAFQFEAERRI